MTNQTQELFEFAQLEPDATGDLRELVSECSTAEVLLVEKVCQTILNEVRNVRVRRIDSFNLKQEKKSK